jgi:hypothetical protein
MGSTLYAMEKDPEFPILVENSLQRTLCVSWSVVPGKQLSKLVPPGKIVELTTFERLASDTSLHIEVDGTILRWTAAPAAIDKPELLKQAYILRLSKREALCVSVTQSNLFLKMAFSKKQEGSMKPIAESEFDSFPAFDGYPELKKHLTVELVRSFSALDTPIYAADKTLLATAEEVYRYLLSVDRDYDKEAINRALISLKLRYQADQWSQDSKKRVKAQTILDLAYRAFKGLDQGLHEKAQKAVT